LLPDRNLRIAGNSCFDSRVAFLRGAAGGALGIGPNYFRDLTTTRDQPQRGIFMNAEVVAFLDSLKTGNPPANAVSLRKVKRQMLALGVPSKSAHCRASYKSAARRTRSNTSGKDSSGTGGTGPV